MKTSNKVRILYFTISVLFVVGSIFDFRSLTIGANYLLIPSLILYYRYKAKKWFLPMVIALLLFYIRDIFLVYGFDNYPQILLLTFTLAIVILYIFAIAGIQKSRVHKIEVLSLLIMYGFLGFLFFSIGELVPQVMPSYTLPTYFYLLSLTLLLALTFTQYLMKSHYASLWLMLAAASLLVSEISLFFKLHVISDVSVNLFFPLFHVIAYYALVEHALHRRRSSVLPGF